MKRLSVAVGILLFGSMVTATVHAGALNQYEAEVVEAAQKIYEYEGVQYKVEQSYIDQLVAYLSSDGVDLTAQQRDEVLQSAYGSIETGVLEGYLQPTTPLPVEVTPTPAAEAATSENTAEETVSGEDGSTDDQEQISDTSDPEATDTTTEDASANQESVPEAAEEKDLVTAEELIKNVLKAEQAVTPTPVVQASPEGSIFDSLNDKDKEDSSIIKETGFNFSNSIIVITGMGILMLVAIYVTFRSGLLAHDDE